MGINFIWGFTIGLLLGVIIMGLLYIRWRKQKNSYNQFIQVVENTKDFIYYAMVKPKIQFKYISPSAENIFGVGSIEKAINNIEIPFVDIHPEDYDTLIQKVTGKIDFSKGIIQRWKDKDGNYRWFEEYATPIYKNGVLVALQGVIRDIDDKVKLQQDLEYRINHDVLTGLYNREYFELTFTKYNEQIDTSVAIILCDLDELKPTNDNFGHKMGDALIKATADLLNQFSSKNITVARIGGDEFAFILSEKNEEEINHLVNNIIKTIDYYNDSDSILNIKISIGSSFSKNSIGKMTELFSVADKDMYRDKKKRKQMIR